MSPRFPATASQAGKVLAEVERWRAGSGEARLSEPITVMVADDHELVARSVRLGLSRERDMAVLAEAGEASTTPRSVMARMPRVLVLIVQAANGSTVELIRGLRAQAPATAIVVLTGEDAATFADRVMGLGVMGYVLAGEAEGQLPCVHSQRRRLGGVRQPARGRASLRPSGGPVERMV